MRLIYFLITLLTLSSLPSIKSYAQSHNSITLEAREKAFRKKIKDENLNAKQLINRAEELLIYANYRHALVYLELYQEKEPTDEYANYLMGQCYLSLGDAREKEAYKKFSRYVANSKKINHDAYYYLGKSFQLVEQFDDAIEAYKRYISLSHKSDLNYNPAIRGIETSENAKEIVKNPVDVKINNIGSTINTIYPEYVPVISTDESILIFTSRRAGSTGGLMDLRGNKDELTGDYYEDIYYSIKQDGEWTTPKNIGNNINTEAHDANIGLSPDGQELLIYKSDGFQFGNIYSCKLNGTEWSSPEKLPYPINTKYWEGSASITPSINGDMIFFASNRPDGYGGKDIYLIRKLPDGKWAEPMNLGPTINTRYDEDAPFIHPDGKTLYFSSQGHKSMGGFDIFSSICTDLTRYNEWTTPENIGYPINTSDHDLYFVLSASGERGYYASKKLDGYGDEDIYVIEMPESSYAAPKPLTLVKGKVSTDQDSLAFPEDFIMTVRDNDSKEIIGIFKPSKLTGKYIIIVPVGANYSITGEAKGYEKFNHNINFKDQDKYIEINKDIRLISSK